MTAVVVALRLEATHLAQHQHEAIGRCSHVQRHVDGDRCAGLRLVGRIDDLVADGQFVGGV